MEISPIVRYGLFSAAAGLGCLAIAYGFDAVGQAGVQEALFLSGIYYNGAVESVHCRVTRAQVAGNKPDRPLE
jgi:hypothetical protein